MSIVIVNEDAQTIIIQDVGVQGPQGDSGTGVASVNGDSGPAVVLDSDDISQGATNKYYTAAQARTDIVAATIVNGDLTHSPDGNSVFDALALKADTSSLATVATSGSHLDLSNIGTNSHETIDTHLANTSNPHSVTKSQVGLANADNTSDANKPISTATQTALDLKVDENGAITGATKTKITYDAKGLVTSGADATTADIADSSNKRYVTDAQLVVIGNTSGTNTGDQNLSGYELLSNKDTDGTLAANSDTKYPSQKATKTYADTKQTGSTKLTDIAALSYASNALKVIRVNAGETAYELAAPSGGGTWGSITGTLSSQTDLQSALDAKLAKAGGTMTGSLILAAGTASASTAPAKLQSGTSMTTPENGAIEYDGSNVFITIGGTRFTFTRNSATQTLSNKRLNPRMQSISSSATVTPNADDDDIVVVTAQAAGLTLANWSGTPVAGQAMIIRVKDNGTARTIAFGSQYRAFGVSLPTTTTISKTLYISCIWNAVDTKIDVLGVVQEI